MNENRLRNISEIVANFFIRRERKQSMSEKLQLLPKIYVGGSNVYLVTSKGTYSCGDNRVGQLGIGNELLTNSPTKITIKGETIDKVFTSTNAFDNTYFLTKTRKFYCCGGTKYILSVDKPGKNESSPVIIPFFKNKCIVDVYVGGYSCFVKTSVEVFTFGENRCHQIGFVSTNAVKEPKRAVFGSRSHVSLKEVAVGYYFSVALFDDNSIYSTGKYAIGQGEGCQTSKVFKPIEYIENMKKETVKQISAGGYHVMVLFENGKIYCWGANSSGELGIGTSSYGSNVEAPVKVKSMCDKNIIKIECTFYSTCFISKDLEFYFCGEQETYTHESLKFLSVNKSVKVPRKLETEMDFVYYKGGLWSNYFVTRNGEIYVSGSNKNTTNSDSGQLGVSSFKNLVKLTKMPNIQVLFEKKVAKRFFMMLCNETKFRDVKISTNNY